MFRLFTRAGLLALALCAFLASPALAVFNCTPTVPAAIPLFTGGGILESVIVNNQGQLFFSDSTKGELLRIDHPGGPATIVATGLSNTGGLAFDTDQRYLFVGVGNSFGNGALGNLIQQAKIVRVDTLTGSVVKYAGGLQMANGVARASDGTIYASNDLGFTLDKVAPGGVVTNGWAPALSGNGLAIDSGDHWLYVNQTFIPAQIERIPLDHPGPPQVYLRGGLLDLAAGLDGLTIDPLGRLVAAANSGLSIWRVNADRSYCAIGRNLLLPSAVAYGHGSTGFSAGHLYAVTFTGGVFEIPGGYVAP